MINACVEHHAPIVKEVVMAVPPRDPRYRRYWGYYNRPVSGCGCLYTLLLIVVVWWLVSLLFPAFAIWY